MGDFDKKNFRWVIFKLILMTDGWVISSKIVLRWMSLDLTDDKSTVLQVMTWCCQATSLYLSQNWPRSLLLVGVTRLQWGNMQVMTWCCQATSHYLSQYWPRSLLPHGVTRPQRVNSLRLRQNRCHFADDVFQCNFWNEKFWIPIKISLKFVPKGPINNIPALVQIMAWCRTGDKPLSGPMMTQLNDAYMHHSASMS